MEHQIGLNGEHAQARKHARAARRGGARRPARTGRRTPANAGRTALKSASGQGTGHRHKHRGRPPAEPVAEVRTATGQQSPVHLSRPGYAISRSCRCEGISISAACRVLPRCGISRHYRYHSIPSERTPGYEGRQDITSRRPSLKNVRVGSLDRHDSQKIPKI